jgi:signal transduction histidine kinase
VIAERVAFWRPLAEDQDRVMSVTLPAGPALVRVSAEDLAACADVLFENVFTHTPEGAALMVRLSHQAGGGAWLVVADDGPGFPPDGPVRRGLSRGGSTGLGLDIARRVAEASGGTMTIGRSATGGGSVTLGLGPPDSLAFRRRHRRAGPSRGPAAVLPHQQVPLPRPEGQFRTPGFLGSGSAGFE